MTFTLLLDDLHNRIRVNDLERLSPYLRLVGIHIKVSTLPSKYLSDFLVNRLIHIQAMYHHCFWLTHAIGTTDSLILYRGLYLWLTEDDHVCRLYVESNASSNYLRHQNRLVRRRELIDNPLTLRTSYTSVNHASTLVAN